MPATLHAADSCERPAEQEYSPPTAKVDLGGAGNFVILSKSGITDVPASAVTGNIGVSPITGAADHLACTEVTGKVYSVDSAGPSPCHNIMTPQRLTNAAVGDMQTALHRRGGQDSHDHRIGRRQYRRISRLLPSAKAGAQSVSIPANVTIKGGSHDVWIFQISKNLVVASGAAVILGGNAQAQNIFWQIAGKATLGTTSHVEGIILAKTLIAMKTGASINGRLLSQTAVTLQMNSVTAP